jgi:hypothetical protein
MRGEHTLVTASKFNTSLHTDIPVVENYTYHGEFPDIKPPMATTSKTRFGECLVIAGTESLYPIVVETESSAFPTTPGQVVASIPLNPTLLSSTRLAKISENYTFWYPKEFVIEYVPLGSALDVGALISVPTLDPEDTFVGSSGNTAIRRALSYERSVSFNIYDHPQFLLPPTESDDLFFITPGQNARQEISHVWHAMAQSTFPARSGEASRTLGWFKLHYVIELYEPRLLDSLDSTELTFSAPSDSALTLFGANREEEAIFVLNLDYCTDNLTGLTSNIWEIDFQSVIGSPPGPIDNPIEVRFGETLVRLTDHVKLYLRVQDYIANFAVLYTNLSDCFSNSNPGSWASDYTPMTTTNYSWSVIALPVTV